jgi:hypothetical protein
MRFSVIDLITPTVCFALGLPIAEFLLVLIGKGRIAHIHDAAFFPAMFIGVIFYFTLVPLVYRWLRLPPLFLPKCPHCGKRPGYYNLIEAEWPQKVVSCGCCGGKSQQWYVHPAYKDLSPEMPAIVLSWPQHIGNWRRIGGGDQAKP